MAPRTPTTRGPNGLGTSGMIRRSARATKAKNPSTKPASAPTTESGISLFMGHLSLRPRLAINGQRRMDAVLTKAQIGAHAVDLLQQPSERRRFLDAPVTRGHAQRAVAAIDHLVGFRFVGVGRALRADGDIA